jgi:hypothetical protein
MKGIKLMKNKNFSDKDSRNLEIPAVLIAKVSKM